MALAKRPIIKAKKIEKDEQSVNLCFFTLYGDIDEREIIECDIITIKGSITTLYCRREHDYSIRSVMRQLGLSEHDKIDIIKTKVIGQSDSNGVPFLGTTNII